MVAAVEAGLATVRVVEVGDMSGGYYNEAGSHHCPSCDARTHYRSLSGGCEWVCDCGDEGLYPEGSGGPRARLLTQGPDGIALLRAQMDQEIARRKGKGEWRHGLIVERDRYYWVFVVVYLVGAGAFGLYVFHGDLVTTGGWMWLGFCVAWLVLCRWAEHTLREWCESSSRRSTEE